MAAKPGPRPAVPPANWPPVGREAGFLHPDRGKIEFDDTEITGVKPHRLFQLRRTGRFARGTDILAILGLFGGKKRSKFAKSGFAPVQGYGSLQSYVSLQKWQKIDRLEEIDER